MVAQPLWIVHPREGLTMHSSWLLILQRLVETINDAYKEIFSHLTDLLGIIRLIPLSKSQSYISASGLFFLISLHKTTKQIVRDGLILG